MKGENCRCIYFDEEVVFTPQRSRFPQISREFICRRSEYQDQNFLASTKLDGNTAFPCRGRGYIHVSTVQQRKIKELMNNIILINGSNVCRTDRLHYRASTPRIGRFARPLFLYPWHLNRQGLVDEKQRKTAE